MSARSRVVTIGFAAVLAGCGAVDPCDGQSGTCVGVTLTGSIGAVDAVRIDISGAATHGFTSRLTSAAELPIAVPVLLKEAVKGTLQVSAVGMSGNGVVALGGASVTIVPGGRTRVDIPMAKVAGPTCTDKARDGSETDVDCGGSCPPCANGKQCARPADCAGGVCSGGKCVSASCMDGARNGKETDQDCGGDCPTACDDGKKCMVAADCKSGRCNAMNSTCEAPGCMDGVKNGGESDQDCGGPCPVCDDGRACAMDGDCKSRVCDPMAHTCSAPSCIDKMKNGSETDADCGGACMPCAAGKACNGDGDCLSKACAMGTCSDVNCMDNQKNGAETDIDCGGDRCMPCTAGKSCQMPTDCLSMVCTSNSCRAPNCMDGVKNAMETDTDCGGNCPRCKDGSACKAAGDCVSTNCKANVCAPLFTAKSSMLNNGAARNVEVADVNGDKIPDVLTVLNMSSQLAVMIGDGMGGFTSTRYFPTAANSGPVGISVCDFNRDGKLDAVTSGYGNNSVSVLTGDGAGAFALASTVPTQAGPWYVACGDLVANSPALVTTNYTANSITAAYSVNAPGGVTPQHTPTGSPSPRSVALLDYNKDGALDAVVLDNSANLELFGNDRAGRLVRQSLLRTVGGCNDNLAVADLNGDGWLDVVATSSCNGGNLDAFLSNKVAGFLNAARIDNGNAQTVAVAAGDFTGDSVVDLVTNGAGFSLSLLVGGGNGFAPASKQDSAGQPITSLRAADFNRDGKIDLVGVNNAAAVVMLLNNR